MRGRPRGSLILTISAFSIGASVLTLAAMWQGLRHSAAVGQAMRAAVQTSDAWPRVAVIVPARDEEMDVELCITSILAQDYPAVDVVAVDDGSTDRTPAILADLQRRHPHRLRVVRATEPPAGWVGKTHALRIGHDLVSLDVPWLLFVDADVRLKPGTLRAAVAYVRASGLDLLSLVPAPRTDGFWPRLLIPLIARFYLLAHVDPTRPVRRNSPEEAVAIGQFILVAHAAYRTAGGHQAVRGSTAEDVALARRFRAYGFTTLMVNAPDFADVITYRGLGELWEGVSKNLFVVARGRWSTLATVLALEWSCNVLPLLLLVLPRRPRGGSGARASAIAAGLVVLSNARYLRTINVPLRYVALYPLSAVLASLIFLDSARKVHFSGSVTWKGRAVDMRSAMH